MFPNKKHIEKQPEPFNALEMTKKSIDNKTNIKTA